MNKLQSLRSKIDKIDDQILINLQKRFSVVAQIGDYKRINRIKPLDSNRWSEVLNSRIEASSKLNISKKFTLDLFNLIHKYSLKIQS